MMQMKRLLLLLFAFLMFMKSTNLVQSANMWSKISPDTPIVEVYISALPADGHPPWDPFNDSSIVILSIARPTNSEEEKQSFTLSEWNLSRVLEEYRGGVKNYLPNVTDEFCSRGCWNSTITWWEVRINSTDLRIYLHSGLCDGCMHYIVFECHRNERNVSCKWSKPIIRETGNPWDWSNTSKITTSSIASTETGVSSKTSSTSSPEKRKLCGPALLVGPALIPVLVRRWKG